MEEGFAIILYPMILRSIFLKILLATFLTACLTRALLAQSVTPVDSVYTFADEAPQFPGGERALMDTIIKNLKLPDYVGSGPQSKYKIEYTVEKDGTVSDISVNARIKEEADAFKKVFSKLKFEPAKLDGKTVRVRMMIPIHISYK
jgi:Gram-negative bacterial TonB protein C-terminal